MSKMDYFEEAAIKLDTAAGQHQNMVRSLVVDWHRTVLTFDDPYEVLPLEAAAHLDVLPALRRMDNGIP